jgi:hypothetical protein
MAVNGVDVPPPPPQGTERWRDATRTRRARLTVEERSDPTWEPTGKDAWWVDYFKVQHDAEMIITAGVIGRRNTWNREGRLRFWGVPGRTLEHVVDDIQNGVPRLEKPPSPPPSPTPAARR